MIFEAIKKKFGVACVQAIERARKKFGVLCVQTIERVWRKSLVSLVSKQLKESEKKVWCHLCPKIFETREKPWCPLCPHIERDGKVCCVTGVHCQWGVAEIWTANVPAIERLYCRLPRLILAKNRFSGNWMIKVPVAEIELTMACYPKNGVKYMLCMHKILMEMKQNLFIFQVLTESFLLLSKQINKRNKMPRS